MLNLRPLALLVVSVALVAAPLEAQYPELIESPSAREGHAAHWVAQQYLLCNYSLPAIAPNGEPISKEMLEGSDLYEQEIKWVNRDGSSTLHIEEKVSISNIHEECWGTPDCWVVVNNHLHIFDYKFGHGYVEVFENLQLLEYAVGITQKVSVEKITMTIIQPRCYVKEGPIRSWTIPSFDLFNYWIPLLQRSESVAMEQDAPCAPNLECAHCSARHVCSALQTTVGRVLDIAKMNIPFELDSRQTAIELRHIRHAAQLLDARLTGLEEQAKSMIVRGEYIPGFKLEPGQGRDHWSKDVSEVITLGEMMGINLTKPQDVITPTQARKAGMPDDILSIYSERIPGKLKLVEDNNAAKVFRK